MLALCSLLVVESRDWWELKQDQFKQVSNLEAGNSVRRNHSNSDALKLKHSNVDVVWTGEITTHSSPRPVTCQETTLVWDLQLRSKPTCLQQNWTTETCRAGSTAAFRQQLPHGLTGDELVRGRDHSRRNQTLVLVVTVDAGVSGACVCVFFPVPDRLMLRCSHGASCARSGSRTRDVLSAAGVVTCHCGPQGLYFGSEQLWEPPAQTPEEC